jgi:glycosyltransferase involved in cell wall biosynthesis
MEKTTVLNPQRLPTKNDLQISVIIPTYNRRSLLARAINSVLEQSFKNFELIVIDDGSCDGTKELIEQQFSEKLIYFKQENRGVSNARNRGVEMSCGEWVAFLDSDDYWHPDKLKQQISFLQKNVAIKALQTQEFWRRKGKIVNPLQRYSKPQGWIFEESLKVCTISPSSLIISKTVFIDLGGFDEELKVCEDYDLWLRLTPNYRVELLEQSLITKTGGHPNQLSTSLPAMERFRIYSLLKVISLLNLSPKQKRSVEQQLKIKLIILYQGIKKRGRETKDMEELISKVIKTSSFSRYREELQQLLLSPDGWLI